jgi:aminopeptidase N
MPSIKCGWPEIQFCARVDTQLGPINPQVAARMARNFERWKRFEPKRKGMMKAALGAVSMVHGLSKEPAEVVGLTRPRGRARRHSQ